MESRKTSVKNALVGFVLGVTSMLPGISGATMAVVFGIYERLIRDIADLKTYLFKDFRFILFLAIGGVAGMLLCAKVLDGVLDTYPAECMLFFTGLIAGQLIPLSRSVVAENGGTGFSRNNILSFAAGLALMLIMVVFTLMSSGKDVEIGHDAIGIVLMFFIGVIVAISAILPGLSHSTILLVFGLMSAFLAAISDMDILFLVAIAAGAVIGAIGFAKLFQKALERHHLTAAVFILGLTLGSVFVILANVANSNPDIIDILVGMVLLIAGFAISMYSDKNGKSI